MEQKITSDDSRVSVLTVEEFLSSVPVDRIVLCLFSTTANDKTLYKVFLTYAEAKELLRQVPFSNSITACYDDNTLFFRL